MKHRTVYTGPKHRSFCNLTFSIFQQLSGMAVGSV